MMNPGTSDLPLENTGKERLKRAIDAQTIANSLVEAGRLRDDRDTKIKGMVDMNRPFSEDKLKKLGRGWECNIDFGDGRSAILQGLAPYYDLFSSSKHYIEIETGFGSDAERSAYSTIITEEVDCYLKEYSIMEDEEVTNDNWDGFDFNVQQKLNDMMSYGVGYLFFDHKLTWRFRNVSRFKVRVPDGTRAGLSNLDLMTVEDDVPIHRLAGEARSGAGWNQKAVLQAIKNASPDTILPQEPHEYQQTLNDLENSVNMHTNKVKLVHIYVKELDGRISHYVVERDKSQSNEPEFMMRKHSHFSGWREIFCPFFIDVMGGTWNGSAGLGKLLFGPMSVKTRLSCKAVNLGFLRAAVNLKAKTPNAIHETPLIMTGGVNIWHSNFDLENAHVVGDMEGLLNLDAAIDNRVSSNTGVFRTQIEKQQGNPRTAEEVRLQFSTQALLGTSQVNRFYSQIDRFYRELVRRIIKDEKLRDRIKKRNVPLEALNDLTKVVAMRSVGNGSPYMRQQAILQIQNLVPFMTEEGRMRYAQDAASALGSHNLSARYFPDKLEDSKGQHNWDATVENGQMRLGQRPLVIDEQNHVIHLQTHFETWGEAFESLQQGADPLDVWSFSSSCGPHCADHLQRLEGNETRKDELKALRAQWKRFAKLHDQLEQQINEQQQQRQQQQQTQQRVQNIMSGVDPAVQIKAAETQQSMAMKEAKQIQLMRHKEEAHQQKLRTQE